MDSKKGKQIRETFKGTDKETKRYDEKGKDVEKKTARGNKRTYRELRKKHSERQNGGRKKQRD